MSHSMLNRSRFGRMARTWRPLRLLFAGITLAAGCALGARSGNGEPAWENLLPASLKACEPVLLPRNPLRQVRIDAPKASAPSRTSREALRALRRHLDAQVRGVVSCEGRALLLLGSRVCRVGQELPLPAARDGENSGAVSVRIKSVDTNRLVLLVRDGTEEESACEEWVYPIPELLVQR